jgi:hypothetical protein
MLESTAFRLARKFGPEGIDDTVASAADLRPGEELTADFLFSPRSQEHAALTAYLGLMPPAVKETIRAALFHALSAKPAVPVLFAWRPAYYFAASVSQWPATETRQGAITLTVEGPFPRDANSPVHAYSMLPRSTRGSSRKPSSKGAPRPASRSPSRRSRKSS